MDDVRHTRERSARERNTGSLVSPFQYVARAFANFEKAGSNGSQTNYVKTVFIMQSFNQIFRSHHVNRSFDRVEAILYFRKLEWSVRNQSIWSSLDKSRSDRSGSDQASRLLFGDYHLKSEYFQAVGRHFHGKNSVLSPKRAGFYTLSSAFQVIAFFRPGSTCKPPVSLPGRTSNLSGG